MAGIAETERLSKALLIHCHKLYRNNKKACVLYQLLFVAKKGLFLAWFPSINDLFVQWSCPKKVLFVNRNREIL